MHHRYYADPPYVVVRGNPSAAMVEKLEQDEKPRITARMQELGPEGLERALRAVDEAIAEHEKPIPSAILTSFHVPDIKSLSWIQVQSVQETGDQSVPKMTCPLAKHLASDKSSVPFFVQYDHTEVRVLTSQFTCLSSPEDHKSSFITINGIFALNKLPNHLLPYVTSCCFVISECCTAIPAIYPPISLPS